MDVPMLPWRGHVIQGLFFSSGHCFYLYHMTDTPYAFGPESHLLMMSPDGQNVCYADPDAVGPIAQMYHAIDTVVPASITWDAAGKTVAVVVRGVDGSRIELRAELLSNWRTALFNALVATTPKAFMRSAPMVAAGEVMGCWLLGIGRMKMSQGSTETGKEVRYEDGRVAFIASASGRLNGKDLGTLCRPTRSIRLGDFRAPDRALFMSSTLYLEAPADFVRTAAGD